MTFKEKITPMEKQDELFVNDLPTAQQLKDPELWKQMSFRFGDIFWPKAIFLCTIHVLACFGLYRAVVDPDFKWQTMLYFILLILTIHVFGLGMGAHRYWAHRSFKANLPLRLIMAFFQTLSIQESIYKWCSTHRLHHKYSDTNADPHNIHRGFFYSQIGWLMLKESDLVKQKGKNVIVTDLLNDPIVHFQDRFYAPLVIITSFIITMIPYYLWNESLLNSFLLCICYRFVYSLTLIGFVTSASHLWGRRPYNKDIEPTESWLTIYVTWEGYHNYHHIFPWDYSASEHDPYHQFNPATIIIQMFAKIGWAYDLKKPSKQMIEERKSKTGDGSKGFYQENFLQMIHSLILGLFMGLGIPLTPFLLRSIII